MEKGECYCTARAHCALQLGEEIRNWSLGDIVRPFAAAAPLLASLTLQKCGKIGDSGSSRGVGEHFAGIVPQAPGVHPGLLTGLSTHQGFRLTAPPTRGLRSWYMGQSSPHAVGLRWIPCLSPFYILCLTNFPAKLTWLGFCFIR